MLSLQGLVSVLLLTSVSAWSANPVLDDKDLMEQSDYGVIIGGSYEHSTQSDFKGEIDTSGKFMSLARDTSLASVGFSAFGRVAFMINVGTCQSMGGLSAMAVPPTNETTSTVRTSMRFDTKPAMIWGGKLCVQLYNEGCVRAMGAASYAQSNMPIKMASGYVNRTHFQLVPHFDAGGNKTGLFVVPNAQAASFASPSQAYTPDSVFLSSVFQVYDPSATLEFSQYEIELMFGYGQKNCMFLGAKLVGGASNLTTSESSLKNYISQDIGALLPAILGVKSDITKIEGTRSSYIAPIVGFCLKSNGLTIDVSKSFIAQQDMQIRAAITF